MPKNVNIHLKTTGAEQTKQQLEQTGQAAKDVGQKTAEGQKQAAPAVEQSTEKLGALDRVFKKLQTSAAGFITGFLGLQAVTKLITFLQEKLERVQKIQQQIYEQSIALADVGQALEFQTGTRGKQEFWTERALALQRAGALRTPEIAQQMLVSMDIAFAAQGGIKNEQIRKLGEQLASFVGAAGLGPEEVSKIFEFAGAAQIAPTSQAYKQFFAQLQAGFTASKAVNFGSFMTGLQQGGTGYLAMGGTLTEAISTFASARAVMANEALAATLVEQVSRLSSGGYEKPRQAIEQALGVKWEDLPMDERAAALLQHVKAIPERQRAQTLAEQGFPLELTTALGKMVSPEAARTLESTRRAVKEASTKTFDAMIGAYLESIPALQRQVDADISTKTFQAAPEFGPWQRRIKAVKNDVTIAIGQGQDRWIIDHLEPYVVALEQMRSELDALTPEVSPEYQEHVAKLRRKLTFYIKTIPVRPLLTAPEVEKWVQPFEFELETIRSLTKQREAIVQPNRPQESPSWELPTVPGMSPANEGPQATNTVNNFDYRTSHIMVLNPVTGMNKQDLGIEPPRLA